jgi:hypothetical protein
MVRPVGESDRVNPSTALGPARFGAMLRAVSGPVLTGTPLLDPRQGDASSFIERFEDEHAHRRPVDRPFLSAMLGLDPGDLPPGQPLDVALWWRAAAQQRPADTLEANGPLCPWPPASGIEVWIERDLCALHALWRLAREGHPDLVARCLDAAEWHVANTQPDNATNHPWAIHVFMALGDRRGSAEAVLYATGLLHACQVAFGRPDRLSAAILLDASRELDFMCQTR